MPSRFLIEGGAHSPPPERGRSASDARRVGVEPPSKFNRTSLKTERARTLRRAATEVEKRLWWKLKNRQLGCEFRRHHPAGPYVLDFFCPQLNLAIELDGGQHAHVREQARDRERDAWLRDRGVIVLRFWNSDITGNLNGVLETILDAVSDITQSEMTPTRRWRADLPLSGGGENAASASAVKEIS